jgi:hypothetical protein
MMRNSTTTRHLRFSSSRVTRTVPPEQCVLGGVLTVTVSAGNIGRVYDCSPGVRTKPFTIDGADIGVVTDAKPVLAD